MGRIPPYLSALVAAGAMAAIPLGAWALGVVGIDDTTVVVESVDAVVWRTGPQQALLETIVVAPGDARRLAILRAFPAPPTEISRVDLATLTDLRDAATANTPYHLRVRERLFGPSIMTPLLAPLLREPVRAPPAPIPTVRSSLGVDGFAQFSGPSITSTITLQRMLPAELELWLESQEVALTHAQRDLAARFLDRGWTVVAASVGRTDPDAAFTFGPWLYRFESSELVVPPVVGSAGLTPITTLYVVDDEARTPRDRAVMWNDKPWAPGEGVPRETLPLPTEVSYWGRLDADATFRLQGLLGDEPPRRVLRGRVEEVGVPIGELVLEPTADAVPIPSRSGQGRGLDLLLCALLGLAPLLYAPESWLLLWAAANARAERTRGEPLGLAGALWPLYALVVALFWVVVLPGAGRVAAIVPLFVGAYRLFRGEPQRERGPVRVDFKRKLKPSQKAAKSGTPKNAQDGRAPGGASKPPVAKALAGASKPPVGASKPPDAKKS